jgi:hypothetical protein
MAKPPINPQVWRPPAVPALDGVYARNRLLALDDETAVARVRLPEVGA